MRNSLSRLPLDGLKVIDAASLFAGPVIATLMADFGADVVKVEHPRGDGQRHMVWQKNGTSLWWSFVGRNKRCVTLDLHKQQGQALLKELATQADILIENFRPGTMEAWGLGYEDLKAVNPRLIMVRVTAFGQTGPYSQRPGFGTLAESISGFAYITGQPDGPPTLPPFGLADGVAACFGTFAAMFAVYERDVHGSNQGQYIDLSIYEPLFWILGPQALVYDQLGVIQERVGNRAPFTSPRNAYCARDGQWFGLSASAQSIAERVMRIIGREDLLSEPWFADQTGRIQHQDELDEAIGGWIGAHDSQEVIAEFEKHEGAIAPIYSIADIFMDPHYQARETITSVEDPKLGTAKVQNAIPRMSRTPGKVRHLGPDLGAHNHEVFVEQLGHTEDELDRWRSEGVI